MPIDGVTEIGRPSASTGASIAAQQLVRDLLDIAALPARRHAGQQHHELVAAEARDDVGRRAARR